MDSLYAFFVQWSPNIYGGDDIDPLSRGFVMVDEDEAEEQPKKTMDIIDDYYKPEMKRLTRQMTKDWEVRLQNVFIWEFNVKDSIQEFYIDDVLSYIWFNLSHD